MSDTILEVLERAADQFRYMVNQFSDSEGESAKPEPYTGMLGEIRSRLEECEGALKDAKVLRSCLEEAEYNASNARKYFVRVS